MKRILQLDPLSCSCGGELRLVSVITPVQLSVIERFLSPLGRWPPPTRHPKPRTRPPPPPEQPRLFPPTDDEYSQVPPGWDDDAMYYASAFSPSIQSPLVGSAVGAFCAFVAVGCLAKGKARSIALRLVGALVLLAGISYLVSELAAGNDFGSKGTGTSALKAVMFLVVFGTPAGYFMITGRFPKWGKGATAFNREHDPDE